MPDMNGFDTTRLIRAMTTEAAEDENPLNQIPVIALTGESDSQELRSRLYEAGVNDYVLKSGDEKAIIDKLFQWLRTDWVNPRAATTNRTDGSMVTASAATVTGNQVCGETVISLFLDEAQLIICQLDEAFTGCDVVGCSGVAEHGGDALRDAAGRHDTHGLR